MSMEDVLIYELTLTLAEWLNIESGRITSEPIQNIS